MNIYSGLATSSFSVSGSLIAPNITGSLEGTASWARNALTASYANNLTVAGTLTAQTLVVQTITSSVLYSSGSNIFGNNISNTQVFTGSLQVTGSTHYLLGNVGIGTTGPIVVSAGYSYLALNNSVNGGVIEFQSNGTRIATINNNASQFDIETKISGPITFGTNNSERLRIAADGNVGIGTTTPSFKLDVSGSSRFTSNMVITGSLLISGSSPLVQLGSTTFVGDFTNPAITFGSTSNGIYTDSSRVFFKAGGSFAGGFSSDGIIANQILIRNDAFNNLTTAMYIPYRLNAIGLLAGLGGNDTGAITLITSGSVRLYISSSGNVGIGTTTPVASLEISTAETSTLRLTRNNNTANYLELRGGSNGGIYNINTSGTQDHIFQTAGSEKLRITSAGNVGIGTTSPGAKLHISSSTVNDALLITTPNNNSSLYPFFLGGATLTSDNYLRANSTIIEFSRNGVASTIRTVGSSNNLVLQSATNLIFNANGANEYARIDSSGNFGIGTTSPTYKLDVSGSNARFNNSGGSFELDIVSSAVSSRITSTSTVFSLGTLTNNPLTFSTNADEKMRIAANGNVGIGTTSPSEKLDVSGSGKFSSTSYSNLYLDGTNATGWGNNIAFRSQGTDFGYVGSVGSLLGNTTKDMTIWATSGNAIRFYTNGNNFRAIIDTSGNVGIGTTSPNIASTSKGLSIDGSSSSILETNISGSRAGYLYSDGSFTIVGEFRNLPLMFRTNDTERIRITAAGNVGIGNTTPSTKFYVSGYEASNWITTLNNTGSSGHQMYFGYNDGSTTRYGLYITGGPGTGVSSFDLAVANKFYVTSGGNVGIGTTSPSAKLTVTDSTSSMAFQEYLNGAALFLDGVNGDFTGGDYFHILADGSSYLGLGGYGGGTTPLNISSSGNVGIGTTSPAHKLHVVGAIRTQGAEVLVNTGQGGIGWVTIEPTSAIEGQIALNVVNSSGTSFASIRGNGNAYFSGSVGIGTTSPGYKLQVNGDAAFFSAAGSLLSIITQGSEGKGRLYLYDGGNATIGLQTNGVSYFNGGNVGIGTTSPYQAKLDVSGIGGTSPVANIAASNSSLDQLLIGSIDRASAPAFFSLPSGSAFVSAVGNGVANTLGIGTYGSAPIIFGTNNTERVRIDASGNVGIGTTSPTSLLTISKTLAANATYLNFDNLTNTKYNWGLNWSVLGTTNYPVAAIRAIYPADNDISLGFYTYNLAGDVSEKMRITTGGNVGIGTTSSLAPLHVEKEGSGGDVEIAIFNGIGSNDRPYITVGTSVGSYQGMFIMYDQANNKGRIDRHGGQAMDLTLLGNGGNVGIGTTGPTYQLQLSTDSAAKPSTNTWTISSDARIKENIIPYIKGLDALMQINPVTYDYNGKAGFNKIKNNIGIIAQDVLDILPESISTYMTKLNESDENDTELYNFNSHALTYILINAIKELKAEIDILKNK